MRRAFLGLTMIAGLIACQDKEEVKTEFTGNETVYALLQASDYPINGTITFRERLDGSTSIDVALSGTEGNVEHPVHLHMGDISTPSADVAALLTPVLGSTGKSETILTRLADEQSISYKDLVALNACIKIHLSATGESRDIILAGGNIGANAAKDVSTGRSAAFATCKSE
ncbi:hypothetical protein WBG78_05630 [Chryseolinea sp. T2]|uniref:hypothetical protein n=1 Tax=Chryseolinea sp. T2 TaxID=3129255 RepID=UPI0030787CFD